MIAHDEVVDVDAEFEAFFRVAEPLLSRALAAGFGFEVGHDAASEALAYGWRNWDRIAGLANPTGYLYRVGERWALRQQRRRHGQALVAPEESAALVGFEPGLGPALAQLSRRQRQAVVLVAGYAMSHAQAAEFLGVSRTSVQNHYERGLAKLRTALGAHHDH